MSVGWPASLRVIRHAESVGNVDADRARREGLERWDTEERDPDVGLSERGLAQAKALGMDLARLRDDGTPPAVWSSPFRRATDTARIALESCPAASGGVHLTVDERLRDRELGVLDRLTWKGISARHPDLAELRRRFGKFYFRPPGGESWVDVGLRLRSVLADIRARHAGENVIVFAHDVVVLMFRYILEDLDEADVLDISRRTPVRNGGVTTYRLTDGRLALESYNSLVDPD